MSLKPIPPETLEKIREALELKSFSRPYAVLIDPGDLGTVFSYLPLFRDEYAKLPPQLQSFTYRIGPGRFGMIGYVPKNFEPALKANLTFVEVIYNECGKIHEMTYSMEGSDKKFTVLNPHRQEKLLEHARKKKISVKSMVKSRI